MESFISANIYLTEGTGHEVCCIGGYHSALDSQPGGQTYAYATYDTEPGVFSQDVSALSHEIGEWMDDPFVDNAVNCTDNSIMENGDPLETAAVQKYSTFHPRCGTSFLMLVMLVSIVLWPNTAMCGSISCIRRAMTRSPALPTGVSSM